MTIGVEGVPTNSEMIRLLGPQPSPQEFANLRESVALLRSILQDLPTGIDDLDPGHLFPLRCPE